MPTTSTDSDLDWRSFESFVRFLLVFVLWRLEGFVVFCEVSDASGALSFSGFLIFGMFLPINVSIACKFLTSLGAETITALPCRPARPVRPMRCT